MTKTIFITGATGCIGHYVVDQLLQDPVNKLYLLVHDPKRLKLQVEGKNVHFLVGGMTDILKFKDQLAEADLLIHIATAWGDSEETKRINVDRTIDMFNALDPDRCKKIIYFSTSSILNAKNQLQKVAQTDGTWYIKSKYAAYEAVKSWKHADKIITIFPTAVFGGDGNRFPHSHISSGLIPTTHQYLKWLRWLDLDMSLHIMHAKDIAAFTVYAIDHLKSGDYVYGQPEITANEITDELCSQNNLKRPKIQLPIRSKMAIFITRLLRIKLAPWDRNCIANPHFIYQTVCLEDFGLKSTFPTFKSIYEDLAKASR